MGVVDGVSSTQRSSGCLSLSGAHAIDLVLTSAIGISSIFEDGEEVFLGADDLARPIDDGDVLIELTGIEAHVV